MNKKTIIIVMLILIFIIISLFCILIYSVKTVQNIGNLTTQAPLNIQNSPVMQTSFEEIKLSPNAIITFFKNYDGCGHTIKSTENITSNMVNITQSEFSNIYNNWSINKFTNSEIELSKTFNGNCGEHFLVKSNENGFVNIYKIKDDNSLVLNEETQIVIQYLSPTDIEELQNGVFLYGKEELNSYIENFE